MHQGAMSIQFFLCFTAFLSIETNKVLQDDKFGLLTSEISSPTALEVLFSDTWVRFVSLADTSNVG